VTEPWLGHRDSCSLQWSSTCDCDPNQPVTFPDFEECHCGDRADGPLPGYCALCSSVRCDAYPGACTGNDLTEEHH
jgi:hypothetical protein